MTGMNIIKRILKFPIAALLAIGAKLVVIRYRPTIVMVTGSLGKTSAKDAIAAALAPSFYLRKSEKSYNSEFGVPLTIIGAKNPWKNVFSWLGLFRDLLALLTLPNHYPKMLVLEVGADRPGDIMRILRIVSPDAVVVTRLPDVPVHVETYASPAAVREEEFLPAYALAPGAPLIISADDPHARELASNLHARVITYGFAEDADIRAHEPEVFVEEGIITGMKTSVIVHGKDPEVIVRGSLGHQQVYGPLSALALASAFGVKVPETLKGLEDYVPPPGRGRILRGLHDSILIDDSYNASPAALEYALESLKALPAVKRRIAVLGDMLELGRYSVAEHERMGTYAAARADVVVTVGIRSRATASAARAAGLADDKVLTFDTAANAAKELPGLIQKGDAILIKGSQGVRLERIVTALIADPADRTNLVRQEPDWQRIP